MNTLIALTGLTILVLILEIINLRKIIIPVTIVGLLGAFGISISEIGIQASYFHNMIAVNTTTTLFSALFILLAVFLVMMSESFYQPKYNKIADYISIKLVLLIGAIAMVSFGNLAMFFLGLEILSISLYILAASDYQNIRSNEAGMKYFLMGAFASGFVLFGIALLYGATASFDLQVIQETMKNGAQPWASIGIVLVTIGLLFKIAAFPFHFWAPDVYQGSPALTTALMSTLAKIAAIATLYKFVHTLQSQHSEYLSMILVIISIATMFVGNILALRQENIKRMLAYSGISHAGFMMMTLFLSQGGDAQLLYYACAYGFAGIAAFAVILMVCQGKEDEVLSHFRGLGKSQPVLAVVFSLALLSMAGIPILAGFFAKFILFTEVIKEGYIFLVICAVINSIISVYYYFKVIVLMFSKTHEEEQEQQTAFSIYSLVAILAIALNILIGIYPDLILQLI